MIASVYSYIECIGSLNSNLLLAMFFYNVGDELDNSCVEHVLDRRDETDQLLSKCNGSLCTFWPPQSSHSLHIIFYHKGVQGI